MYCKHCGAQNQEFAKFCKSCGTALRQRSAPTAKPFSAPTEKKVSEPETTKPLSAESPKPKVDEYKPSSSTYTPSHRSYTSSSHSTSLSAGTDKLFWASVILLLLTFIGLLAPWIVVKADNESADVSYSDIYKNEGDFSPASRFDESVFKDQVNKLESSWDRMKTAGLIGFIAAGAAVILAFINPKLMTIASLVAAFCFVIAIFAVSSFNSAQEEILEKEMMLLGYADGGSVETGSGIITSLVCSSAASAIGIYKKVTNDY